MQIRIQRTAHKSTVQCLRSYYDSESKRTRQKIVLSFRAYSKPEAEELEKLTVEEQSEVAAWIDKRDADNNTYQEKNTISNAAYAINNVAQILISRPDLIAEEKLCEIEIVMKLLGKAIRKSRKLHSKVHTNT